MKVLVVDVGGTHDEILATGQKAHREFSSGLALTAKQMVARVKAMVGSWTYDAVSIGYPGLVLHGRPVAEPHKIGSGLGWVRLSRRIRVSGQNRQRCSHAGFGRVQGRQNALPRPGRGLGSALIVEGIVEPMELGHLPYRKATYEDYVGIRGVL